MLFTHFKEVDEKKIELWMRSLDGFYIYYV